MSATIEAEKFAEYFRLPSHGLFRNAPIVNVEGRMYDVQEQYLDDVQHLGIDMLPDLVS